MIFRELNSSQEVNKVKKLTEREKKELKAKIEVERVREHQKRREVYKNKNKFLSNVGRIIGEILAEWFIKLNY